MSESERYEALILGSGEGGKFLAWHLAGSGRRTMAEGLGALFAAIPAPTLAATRGSRE